MLRSVLALEISVHKAMKSQLQAYDKSNIFSSSFIRCQWFIGEGKITNFKAFYAIECFGRQQIVLHLGGCWRWN